MPPGATRPLQATAFAALDQLPQRDPTDLLFPAERGGYIDLHNCRNRGEGVSEIVATQAASRLQEPP